MTNPPECRNPNDPKCECLACAQAILEDQQRQASGKAVLLEQYRHPPVPEVVARLQELLAMAQEGKIRWFCLVGEDYEGGTDLGTVFCQVGVVDDAARAVGKMYMGVHRLTHRLMERDLG